MIAAVLRRFGLEPDEPATGLESRSGAGVHAVRTSRGVACYLKVTPAALGPDLLAAARRELRFYRDLAERAPVRTPRLLDAADDGDGVALLLAAAGKPAEAGSWTPGMWAALGRDLAALHDMADLGGQPWTRPDHLREALAVPDLAVVEQFWGATLPRLADLISARTDLFDAMDALPAAFVHGDCHTGNIAVTGEGLTFLDWQMSGRGRPSTDLAFLNVRAAPAGVTPPPALTTAYVAHRGLDRRMVELAILAEELTIYVFEWPPFAAYNNSAGIERVRQRASRLARRWFQRAYA
ncbi:phosphotransferase enzyme family protein [Paractinoplanes globisporus]|uniref:Phosphotransferase enzyme family protein n=1 Tax=Paractinoplanes globisporus TaxID=113565 RepID=A0ABW6WA33_9ACTN|nr:aminoglycoside phosphotransferase family protein [Actinoplanes globisporus]